jgi:hypothetical protein
MTADDSAGPTRIVTGDAHLPPERLAALADELATLDEERHLSACQACADEVRSYQSLLAITRSERDRLSTPVTSWDTLRSALTREGLLLTPPHRSGRPARVQQVPVWARNAAAAVVLVASGMAIGRLSLREVPPAASARDGNTASNIDNSATGLRLVSDSTASFKSKEDALAALLGAENEYRHAAAYLMVIDSGAAEQGGSANAIRTRLAALDEVAQTTRAALYAAPEDTVLKQYYLSSLGAREATLRELGRGLPKNVRLSRY